MAELYQTTPGQYLDFIYKPNYELQMALAQKQIQNDALRKTVLSNLNFPVETFGGWRKDAQAEMDRIDQIISPIVEGLQKEPHNEKYYKQLKGVVSDISKQFYSGDIGNMERFYKEYNKIDEDFKNYIKTVKDDTQRALKQDYHDKWKAKVFEAVNNGYKADFNLLRDVPYIDAQSFLKEKLGDSKQFEKTIKQYTSGEKGIYRKGKFVPLTEISKEKGLHQDGDVVRDINTKEEFRIDNLPNFDKMHRIFGFQYILPSIETKGYDQDAIWQAASNLISTNTGLIDMYKQDYENFESESAINGVIQNYLNELPAGTDLAGDQAQYLNPEIKEQVYIQARAVQDAKAYANKFPKQTSYKEDMGPIITDEASQYKWKLKTKMEMEEEAKKKKDRKLLTATNRYQSMSLEGWRRESEFYKDMLVKKDKNGEESLSADEKMRLNKLKSYYASSLAKDADELIKMFYPDYDPADYTKEKNPNLSEEELKDAKMALVIDIFTIAAEDPAESRAEYAALSSPYYVPTDEEQEKILEYRRRSKLRETAKLSEEKADEILDRVNQSLSEASFTKGVIPVDYVSEWGKPGAEFFESLVNANVPYKTEDPSLTHKDIYGNARDPYLVNNTLQPIEAIEQELGKDITDILKDKQLENNYRQEGGDYIFTLKVTNPESSFYGKEFSIVYKGVDFNDYEYLKKNYEENDTFSQMYMKRLYENTPTYVKAEEYINDYLMNLNSGNKEMEPRAFPGIEGKLYDLKLDGNYFILYEKGDNSREWVNSIPFRDPTSIPIFLTELSIKEETLESSIEKKKQAK